MEQFIHRENLQRLRRLLTETADDSQRQQILKLLAEEEAKDQLRSEKSCRAQGCRCVVRRVRYSAKGCRFDSNIRTPSPASFGGWAASVRSRLFRRFDRGSLRMISSGLRLEIFGRFQVADLARDFQTEFRLGAKILRITHDEPRSCCFLLLPGELVAAQLHLTAVRCRPNPASLRLRPMNGEPTVRFRT